jgi:hypothetical protein
MKTALDAIRVLDLTRVLAGPWCAQNLADLGAEVIKVERPGAGDDTRTWGPPFLKDKAGNDTTDAAYYLAANRGKKSILLDIATPAGQQAVRELAKISDVVLENYKVGQLKKYGLDYDSLKAVNPRLVYCSVTVLSDLATARWSAHPRLRGDAAEIASQGGVQAAWGLAAVGQARRWCAARCTCPPARRPCHRRVRAPGARRPAHLHPPRPRPHAGQGRRPGRMMCELFGRATATTSGKGGSMHIADFSVGMLGANGVVAAGLPIAVGAAQALKLRGATRSPPASSATARSTAAPSSRR